MPEKKNVMIQMKHTRDLRNAMISSKFSASTVSSLEVRGFSIDESFIPVQIPTRTPREEIDANEVDRLFSYNVQPEASTYIIRGKVDDMAALHKLREAVKKNPEYVEVFADPKISPFPVKPDVCPKDPVGDQNDVSDLLKVDELHEKGMDGSNVMVAIVDTGINLGHLRDKDVDAKLDVKNSWSPLDEIVFGPGKYPKDHGTMCAFDVCITAPNCTLLDIALLRSQRGGATVMEGFLSDAVKAYSNLLELLSKDKKSSLVINNSWGMFNPSWDFPKGDPGNYSDNHNHPFNIIVESLDDAGADILFAAGNCGKKCPDSRCNGATNRPIYGANSLDNVLCIGGVTIKNALLGYSSQGPGRLSKNKPDICAYTHFKGSDIYPADGGTSAACPVAAGVVAAIRSVHSPDDLTPAQLRNILRKNAIDLGKRGFDYKFGYGLIDPIGTVNAISE